MKKIIVFVVVLLVSIILIEAIRTIFNPLNAPNSEIRKNLLVQIPPGTSMNEVITIIKSKKKWNDMRIYSNNGYYKESIFGEVVGKKHISVYIGDYQTFNNYYFVTTVEVHFGFNEESELIDIKVVKMTDGI